MSFAAQTEIGPKTFYKHLNNRQNRGMRGKNSALTSLMLTPMVDMFSLLVIFLLQSFSASPEMPFKSDGLVLPIAAHSDEVVDVPVLAITKDSVYLDAELLGSTKDVLSNPGKLAKKLGALRNSWQKVRQGQEFSGEINIQADKDLPSTTVSEFLGILSYEAYGQYHLTVARGQSAASTM